MPYSSNVRSNWFFYFYIQAKKKKKLASRDVQYRQGRFLSPFKFFSLSQHRIRIVFLLDIGDTWCNCYDFDKSMSNKRKYRNRIKVKEMIPVSRSGGAAATVNQCERLISAKNILSNGRGIPTSLAFRFGCLEMGCEDL
ncbi:hypothetical protein TNIN_455431 [Trichonephila inaurata madagascariensis]|uniref:Uncharacterized protein n=1 Tax=Trichonephila inaurata madagascariensis TaxID=2747483 RepID=A0A8X6XU88_9ARAC|nr:hypothetical protein TNIN_455431 [Trichonephila inaurata madagascariensis]